MQSVHDRRDFTIVERYERESVSLKRRLQGGVVRRDAAWPAGGD